MMNRHGQRRHTHRALRQVFSHLANNDSRDRRLVTLHVNNDRVVTEAAFFDHLGQTLGTRLVIRTRHADFSAHRLNRTGNVRMVGGNDRALSARLACAFKNVHNHWLAVDVHQRFARQTR